MSTSTSSESFVPPARDPQHEADTAKAIEFKREFFWTAFKALDFNGIDGDYAEFGSHGGRTFRLAWDQISQRRIRRHLWAFDSFSGLPPQAGTTDAHPRWQAGAMATTLGAFHEVCAAHGIPRDAYSVVEGYYDATLPPRTDSGEPRNIALAYVDCDLHSSTRAVLEFLRPRLKHGMIVAFDDYFCWSATELAGERRALLEFLNSEPRWRFLRYRDFGWAGSSFLVERADPALGAIQ